MKIGVVIPAYNVGHRLQTVLSKILKKIPGDRIFVIDDGSRDNTHEIALQNSVKTIRHPMNRGKGCAIKTGIRVALESGSEAVLFLDGDGQHDPDCFEQFVDCFESTGCDAVFGVRHFKLGVMPFDRILSNTISSAIVSAVVRKNVPDSQCGYRLFRDSLLSKMRIDSDRFEVETEMAIRTVQMGGHFETVSVPTIYFGSGSHIKRASDTFRFVALIMRSLFRTGK